MSSQWYTSQGESISTSPIRRRSVLRARMRAAEAALGADETGDGDDGRDIVGSPLGVGVMSMEEDGGVGRSGTGGSDGVFVMSRMVESPTADDPEDPQELQQPQQPRQPQQTQKQSHLRATHDALEAPVSAAASPRHLHVAQLSGVRVSPSASASSAASVRSGGSRRRRSQRQGDPPPSSSSPSHAAQAIHATTSDQRQTKRHQRHQRRRRLLRESDGDYDGDVNGDDHHHHRGAGADDDLSGLSDGGESEGRDAVAALRGSLHGNAGAFFIPSNASSSTASSFEAPPADSNALSVVTAPPPSSVVSIQLRNDNDATVVLTMSPTSPEIHENNQQWFQNAAGQGATSSSAANSGRPSSARDLDFSLAELPLTRIYTYQDDVSNKRRSRGTSDADLAGFGNTQAAGMLGSASTVGSMSNHASVGTIPTMRGRMLRDTQFATLSLMRINPAIKHIDLIDAVDQNAPEVVEYKRQVISSAPALGNSDTNPKKYVVQMKNMSELRQIYRLQRRSARESTMAGNYVWKSILWFLNLQNHWNGIVRFLESDRRLVFRTITDLTLDVIVCVVYLCEMDFKYMDTSPVAQLSPSWAYVARPFWIFIVNYIVAILIIAALFLNILATDSFIKLFSFYNFIDIATSVPFIVLNQITNGHYVYIPYFIRAVIVPSRLDGVLRLTGARTFNFDSYRQKLIILVVTILVIIYLGVCSFEYVENNFTPSKGVYKSAATNTSTPYTPIEILYFVMITVSTVGYGDITPTTPPGQVVVIIMIIVGVAVLPGLLADLVDTFRLQQSGGGAYSRGSTPFIVICSVFSYTAKVQDIAHVFLNNPRKRMDIVLLSRHHPHTALKLYVRSPLYRHRITLLHGSGLDPYDLERVQLKYASAAFILADPGSHDPILEDEHNTVRAWAFDDEAPHVPLYVDNLLPKTETLQEMTTTAVICLQDLKQIFLALNCLYRGIGTLIVNLLQPTGTYSDYGDPWRALYADGRTNQFFELPLNPVFVGLTFPDLAIYFYTEFQVVLFGLQIYVEQKDERHIALNPVRTYRIKAMDVCLVVAPSKKDLADIAALTKEQFDRSYVPAKLSKMTGIARRPSTVDVGGMVKTGHSHTTASFAIAPATPVDPVQYSRMISEGMRRSYRRGYPVIAGSQSKVPQCHLLPTPASPRSMGLRSAAHLTRHILVCTHSYDIVRFICTLRTTTILVSNIRPVVILCPQPPTRQELARLAVFPEIYYMIGDARNKADLEHANIDGADKVAVLRMRPLGKPASASTASPNMQHEHEEDFADSSTIMVSHLIYDMYHRKGIRKYVVTELVRRSNIKFLRPTAKPPLPKRSLRPLGSASAAIQAGLSTPNASTTPDNTTWAQNPHFTPIYASGRVISSSMVEPIFFQTYFTPCTISVFHALCGERFKSDVDMDTTLGLDSTGLYYIAVPNGFVGRPYGDLFHKLATEYGMIALGLYRDAVDPVWGNKLPYVITNPARSLLVVDGDLVYVVASLSNLV